MLKRNIDGPRRDTNSWITTFTNLMILLLAFFIVLVNLAIIDQKRRRVALNSLFGSFGFHPGGRSAIGESSGSDITMADSPMVKGKIELEQLQNIAIANGLESEVDVKREPEKIVITLSDRVLFDKGSSVLPEKSTSFLSDLSYLLKESSGLIELRGYADQVETVFQPDPLRSSLHLSTKRSLAVLHFFAEKSKIPVSRIVAHGFGIPTMGNKSQKGKRKWQGQVDIIVNYKEKIPYRLRINNQADRILDFKGFLFKTFGSRNE
ncbi:flagellar motor protein MotB [Thermodesulfobacteriota bacterium]